MKTRYPWVTAALALFFVILSVALSMMACNYPGGDSQSRQATAAAVATLTDLHKEAGDIIQNFEARWYSLEAHLNPEIQSNLATELFLDHYGYARKAEAHAESPPPVDESSWWVTTSVSVTRVYVLEYSQERFKAIADVVSKIDKATLEGKFEQAQLEQENCAIYVFVRQDDTWKLAGLFYMFLPDYIRDWWYAPEWLKEIIGELPANDPCGWIREERGPWRKWTPEFETAPSATH